MLVFWHSSSHNRPLEKWNKKRKKKQIWRKNSQKKRKIFHSPGRTESGKIQKRQTRASPTLPIKQSIVGRRNIIRFNVKVSQYRGRCGDAKKPLESNLTPQSRCIGTLWSHKFVQDGEGATTERQPSNRTSRSACSFMHFNACKSFILTHCREVGRYTCTVTVQNALNDEIPHGNILHGRVCTWACAQRNAFRPCVPLNIYRFLRNQIL